MKLDHSAPQGRRRFLRNAAALGALSGAAPVFAGSAAAEPEQTPAPATSPPTTRQIAAESAPVESHVRAVAPLAGADARPGSDYMVDLLRGAGIAYVSAIPGSAFRGLHESIVNYGHNHAPELIVCVHEEISAGIAHGYAKVAGAPMACLVHSTVGLQHASMAVYNAFCDRAPVMVIAGNMLDASKRRPGVEWLHSGADIGAFVRDFVKWDDIPQSLAHYGQSFLRGVQVASAAPGGPVLIVCDADLQEAPITDAAALPPPVVTAVAPPGGDPAAIARAAAMLIAAAHPVIVADRAARTPTGMERLVELAETLGAPVIDLGGRLNMPTTHALNQTWMQASLLAEADIILGLEVTDLWGLTHAVGDTPERQARAIGRADVKVIGLSAGYGAARSNVQDVQHYAMAALLIEADAETAMPQLTAAIAAGLTADARAAIAARRPAQADAHSAMRARDAQNAANGWDASPISTARLSMELWDQVRHLDWALVSYAGYMSNWPLRLWDFTRHYQYIGGSGGYGVGYNAPASVGAALAHRNAGRIPISIQADGDLMMSPGVLWTLAHHSIPLLVVMHNNRAWHQETMHLKRMANWRDRGPTTWSVGTTITDPDIDFAGLARSMGVWARGPITDPAHLAGAIAEALAVVKQGKPALIDIITQGR